MLPDNFERLLDRAAALCGIGPGFWDIWGRYHETTRAAKQSILRAKGFDATDAASLERSLDAYTRREWDALTPPALVTEEADTLELPLNVAADRLGEIAQVQVRAENGAVTKLELKLSDLPTAASIQLDGRARVRKL